MKCWRQIKSNLHCIHLFLSLYHQINTLLALVPSSYILHIDEGDEECAYYTPRDEGSAYPSLLCNKPAGHEVWHLQPYFRMARLRPLRGYATLRAYSFSLSLFFLFWIFHQVPTWAGPNGKRPCRPPACPSRFPFFFTQPAPLENMSGEVQNSLVLLAIFIYVTMPSRVLWSRD